MAQNFVQDGVILPYINTTGSLVSNGSLVVLDAIVGVATVDIAPDQEGSVNTSGVWELPKKAGDQLAQGDAVYIADGKITKTKSNNPFVGYCFRAAAAGDATIEVCINRGR